MLMFGCCLAASFLMFSRVIQAQPSFFNLLSFAIFAGFPTWYYLIEFKGTLLANGLSILSASAAGYFFSTKNRSALLFVPLLVAAIGIYQSSIFIAVIISIASILFGREDGPRTHTAFFLSFSRLAVLCLVSLLCYFIIWKILLAYFNLEPQYIVGFLNIDMLLKDPGGVIANIAQEAMLLFSGYRATFHGMLPLTGVLFLLGLAASIMRCNQIKASFLDAIAVFFLFIALIFSPFLLHLLTGGYLPDRSLMGIPYLYWLFVAIALQTSYLRIRLLAQILILLITVQYIQISSFSSFSHNFVAVHDQLTASQIYERIANQIDDYERIKSYPLEFVGPLRFPNIGHYLKGHSAVTGSSIFEWDDGNPHRSTALLKAFGMGNFRTITDEQRASIISEIDKMPLWPNEGSVRNINGIIVVKFDEYAKHIRSRIEQHAP